MAKSFDELVKRTTTKTTRQLAVVRTRELLGELLLSEIRELAGKSQRQVADVLGIKQPSLSKLEKQSDMQDLDPAPDCEYSGRRAGGRREVPNRYG